MAFSIYPSELSVGTILGSKTVVVRERPEGKRLDLRGLSPLSAFVTSGFTLSAGSGLSVNVAAGELVIGGYVVISNAVEPVTGLVANRSLSQTNWTPNFIWARLDRDISTALVQGIILSTSPGPPPTSESVLLGVAATDATSVVNVASIQVSPRIHSGSYSAEGGDGVQNFIYTGFVPKLVQVFGKYGRATSPSPYTNAQAAAWSPGPDGFGFNTLEGRTNTDYKLPLITGYGFVVEYFDFGGSDNRGFNLTVSGTPEVYGWTAWA